MALKDMSGVVLVVSTIIAVYGLGGVAGCGSGIPRMPSSATCVGRGHRVDNLAEVREGDIIVQAWTDGRLFMPWDSIDVYAKVVSTDRVVKPEIGRVELVTEGGSIARTSRSEPLIQPIQSGDVTGWTLSVPNAFNTFRGVQLPEGAYAIRMTVLVGGAKVKVQLHIKVRVSEE